MRSVKNKNICNGPVMYECTVFTFKESLTHLPITRMRNRDQYGKYIRGVSGLALEESKMYTFSST